MKELNITPALEVTNLKDALSFCGVTAAENLTGKSYKEDAATEELGVALQISANMNLNKALVEADDTTYANEIGRYLRIVKEEGFKEILCIPFEGKPFNETVEEKYFIFWHEDGLLLSFETYRGTSVNSSHVYFNWLGNGEQWGPSVGCSGGCTEEEPHVFVGDFDGRVALRYNLNKMRQEGKFLSSWVKKPWLWLLNYMDTKGEYDHKAITNSRLAMLPLEIQARLGN